MTSPRSVRELVTVTAAAIGAGGAWGALVAIAARALTPITEADSLIYVALPVGLLVATWLWPKLPKILGFRPHE
jgi:hypothetical protein